MKFDRRQTLIAVIVAIFLPTIVTWIYFIQFQGRSALVGGVGKAIQFGFPAVWVFLWMRTPWHECGLPSNEERSPWSIRKSLGVGAVTGVMIGAVTWGYYRYALDASTLATLSEEITDRVTKLSLTNLFGFIALGAFYSLIHSWLEEYYFRWFVFGQLRRLAGFPVSAVVSGLAFMLHHVIVLSVFFGSSFHTVFLSLSIFVGGLLWAWVYEQSRTLLSSWVSHLMVDAAIFSVGYHMIFLSA